MRSSPTHVIFDLDGTLADSSEGILWSFRATLEKIGLDASEDQLRHLIGPPLGDSFRILGVQESDIDQVVAWYREYYAARGVYEARLYDGVDLTLEALTERGVRLGVATAKRVDFAQQMLGAMGVAHLFDEISGASVDLRVTSKFDIMSLVMDQWTWARGLDVWMVGDRHYDMKAARAHDVSAVGALWGFGRADELRAAGAHWLISRPSELLDHDDGGGSPVCLLEEICDECGAVVDASHEASCPRRTTARPSNDSHWV